MPPTVILVAGLQGSGKTTFCAKLANHLKGKGRFPMLVAADVYRPAAIDQLEILAKQEELGFYSDRATKDVPALGAAALGVLGDDLGRVLLGDGHGLVFAAHKARHLGSIHYQVPGFIG